MSETQLIRSTGPHEVNLPEGSHVAKGRSADAGAAVVRQSIVDSEPIEIVRSLVDRRVNLSPPISALPLADANLNTGAPEVPDNALVRPAHEQEAKAQASGLEPRVNLPARLTHLKIENNRVRAELDGLENLFHSGV